MIYSVGINDHHEPVTLRDASGKQTWVCPIYTMWRMMLRRCYSQKCQDSNPTYIGCTVDENWFLFSNFRKWIISQDWENKVLDKDVIKDGNKVYGPSTCMLICDDLNRFFYDKRRNGNLPIGVSEDRSGRYRVMLGGNDKRVNVGTFDTVEEAFNHWSHYKTIELRRFYQSYQSEMDVLETKLTNFINRKRNEFEKENYFGD